MVPVGDLFPFLPTHDIQRCETCLKLEFAWRHFPNMGAH